MKQLSKYLVTALVLNLVLSFNLFAAIEKNKQVQRFISSMVKDYKFKRSDLNKLFAQVNFQNKIIDSMNRPYERKPWDRYKKLFVTEQRVNRGIEFWQANYKTLEKAQKQFGVPANIIVAILGVETNYGRNQGSYRVIDALSTLAFKYPKRAKFFRKELKHFLLLCKEQGVDPLSMYGSYAGAMGQPQFMPSSYRAYAIDYTGNGKKDLLTNNEDTIGSVANYFKKHGWRKNQAITVPAYIKGSRYKGVKTNARRATYSIKRLKKLGIKPQEAVVNRPNKAGLVKLSYQNKQKEYWLAFHNFYVITRYNTSKQYAMAVFLLSEKLKQKWAAIHPEQHAYA